MVGARRGPWWSSRRGKIALLALSSGLVELLPIEAWLLVLAGYDSYPPDQAAAPFWYLFLVMALAWIIGRRAHGHLSRKTTIVSLLPLLALYLILLRISPSEFGGFGAGPLDFSWIGAQAPAFFSRPGRPTALITLMPLLAFLWWRGMALASPSTTASALRRFVMYMALLLLAVLGLDAVPAEVRDPYDAALTLILIGEVFCGLVSAALARLAEQQAEQHDPQYEASDAQWVGGAILVALSIVVVALFVGLIFDFQSFLALLGYLGPVGIAIGSALTWVENLLALGFSQLLRLVLALLSNFHLPTHALPTSPTPISFRCVTRIINGKQVVQCAQSQARPSSLGGLVDIVLLIFIAVILLLTVAILYIAVRKMLSVQRTPRDPEAADEREALDARGMFAEQMRDLLDRFAQRGQGERDHLQPGTVRYLYRDVLRSAVNRGLERTPAETPDEYARRLTSTAPLAAYASDETEDLLILSEAYNDARYAEREPDAPTRHSLRGRAHRLIRLFSV